MVTRERLTSLETVKAIIIHTYFKPVTMHWWSFALVDDLWIIVWSPKLNPNFQSNYHAVQINFQCGSNETTIITFKSTLIILEKILAFISKCNVYKIRNINANNNHG